MKIITTILLLTITTVSFGQTEIIKKYQKADSLLRSSNISEAYTLLKEIEPECDKKDTLYNSILWYYVVATSELEKQNRTDEKFEKSLQYGLEALALIEKGVLLRFTRRSYICKMEISIELLLHLPSLRVTDCVLSDKEAHIYSNGIGLL